ncbi:MAG: hypothetical protein Q4F80_07025 [bacterium]|nr:hypothetical protein [bacterium]
MGFAASQARFLSLTARLSDNEYEAGQISQERVALTNQMALYADEYDEATNNQVLIANVYDLSSCSNTTVTLSYDVITKGILDGGLGMKLVTSSGLIVVPSEEEMNKQIEELNSSGSGQIYSPADFFVFENVSDTSVLQKNLEDGNFYFATERDENTNEWNKKGYESLNAVTSTYDKSDDAPAKATYDKRMAIAEAKDAMLEMRLDQLESSHKAIETEMESVQKVVDNNVENSFKTFG